MNRNLVLFRQRLLCMRKNLVIQVKVGKRSMTSEKIAENIQTVLSSLETNLDRGMQNIANVITKTTMGPAVKIEM